MWACSAACGGAGGAMACREPAFRNIQARLRVHSLKACTPWRCHLPRLHHRVGDLLAGLVEPVEHARGDRQTRRRGCVAQITQPRRAGAPGLACPVETDLTEQPRLKRMPRRAAGRIMTDRHRPSEPVAEVAWPWRVPHPGPTPMTAPRIGQDQEVGGLGGGHAPTAAPPAERPPSRASRAPAVQRPARGLVCSTRGRPAPGPRLRSVGRAASPVARAGRPRGMGCGASPVMCAMRWSPPWPRRGDATAADHRRCGSATRDRRQVIGSCHA
jgi:hypothetical protein